MHPVIAGIIRERAGGVNVASWPWRLPEERGRYPARGARVLKHLRLTVGLPKAIVLDNGPESAGRGLEAWAYAHGVELRFIRPGKPIENAYAEGFNRKFRTSA